MPNYTTLALVKARLGITGSTLDDYLTLLIDAAEERIDNYCNTRFIDTTTTEIIDGTGSRYLRLRHRPVLSITSVSIDGEALDSAAYEIEKTEGVLAFPEPDEYNPRTRVSGDVWPHGDQNVTVVYHYGYSAVPKSVALAALKATLWLFRNEGAEGAASDTSGTRTRRFKEGGDAMLPPEIAGMLNSYREEGLS